MKTSTLLLTILGNIAINVATGCKDDIPIGAYRNDCSYWINNKGGCDANFPSGHQASGKIKDYCRLSCKICMGQYQYQLTEEGKTCSDISLNMIADERECKKAVEDYGKQYWGNEIESTYPSGCYYLGLHGYFNKHASGTGKAHAISICKQGGGSGSGSISGFAKRQLDKHNYYRSRHGASALKYSKSLENAAQRHANYLASLGENITPDSHSTGPHGENIYQSSSTAPNPSAEGATKSWYDEESDYDYQYGTSKNGKEIGHFTQIVWKGSTEFGIAKAKAKLNNGWYGVWVVAQYNPPGNFVGRANYIANVQQPGWGK